MTEQVREFARLERLSDWLNPILVKETRQALKSRQFIATFFLMLIASWLISVFGVLMSSNDGGSRSLGREFFAGYYMVLGAAIYIVVPFTAFRSLLSERDQHTYEVLSISTLTPRQIVLGKLFSALVQLFIYYSAITPFVGFTYLLKGIDIVTIAFVLLMSMIAALGLCMITLTVSTFSNQRHWQAMLTLAVMGGLISTFSSSIGLVAMTVAETIPFDQPEFWWGLAAYLSYFAGYLWLLMQVAVAQLTFDADNRSTGIRVAACVIFWITAAWLSLGMVIGGWMADMSFITAISIWMCLHFGALGLIITTEPEILSRRVRRSLTGNFLLRLIKSLYMPGGSRGLLLVLVHLAAICIAFLVIEASSGSSVSLSTGSSLYLIAIGLYLTIYLSLASLISRVGSRWFSDFRAIHARMVTVILAALGMILPHTLAAFGPRGWQAPPELYVTDPFSTLMRLERDSFHGEFVLLLLLCGGLVAVLVNARAMIAGLRDVLAAPPPRSSDPRGTAATTEAAHEFLAPAPVATAQEPAT